MWSDVDLMMPAIGNGYQSTAKLTDPSAFRRSPRRSRDPRLDLKAIFERDYTRAVGDDLR